MSFNRTIVELKFPNPTGKINVIYSFNRTIVELKYEGQIEGLPRNPLLIVP